MGFLAPWVLAALPLALVPVILHLIQRRDPPTVEFPAVRYLVQVTEEHQRRLRLRHLLLLIVRTLLIILLIVLLAGSVPVWPHSRRWGYYPSGGLGLVLVIILILALLGRI